ncbi:hypothetical protein [Flavilitoribacter nigricans]|uniref:Uncharacterized protein n=1 Tax=Flavilitoribacter nigricans (strain ATCC 23147 / DSM 23189 / NBRC 102662 / NCIMB 1420 / SS-2) TaxID=1122177 RepID=A0A2D0NH51_FLAN2|nr:hypothetical protein [Flavilitoribacter nigricans]PHN07822.1 hypothetical protein CRP01_04685 [Flavilitoribacter nigricans DSM 23189 = NBRC 102662]
MAYSYTNRQDKTHYIKAVTTKKGGVRYYITLDPTVENLISEIPEGFEVLEYPYDARVVIRKKIPVNVRPAEVSTVQKAMEKHSPVQDFIITSEREDIAIHISQFNHFYDSEYLSADEAKKYYGENVHLWKTYDWILTFRLADVDTRKFQVIRKASVQYEAVGIDEGTDLSSLAEKYCYHVGRESLLNFWIPGEDW